MEEGTPGKSWAIVLFNQVQPSLKQSCCWESTEGGDCSIVGTEHHASINRQWKSWTTMEIIL